MQGFGKNCASSINDASTHKLSKAAEDSDIENQDEDAITEKRFEEQIKRFDQRLNIDYRGLVEKKSQGKPFRKLQPNVTLDWINGIQRKIKVRSDSY